MTKNEIIEQWYNDGIVQKIVRTMTGNSNDPKYDDLISIVYLALLEKPEELIQRLQRNGEQMYYISRIVAVQINLPRSPFTYNILRFPRNCEQIDSPVVQYADETGSDEWDALMEYIDMLPSGDKEMLLLSINAEKQKDVAKHFGITQGAFSKHIIRICNELKWFKECEEAVLQGLPQPKRKKRKYIRF